MFPPHFRHAYQLMAKHPKNSSVTSPATHAKELSTSTQTISYNINGKPSYDNVIAFTRFFGASADYLLFHVKSENIDMHEKTGLSNEAIDYYKFSIHRTPTPMNSMKVFLHFGKKHSTLLRGYN